MVTKKTNGRRRPGQDVCGFDRLQFIQETFALRDDNVVLWGPRSSGTFLRASNWEKHIRDLFGTPVKFYTTPQGYRVVKVNVLGRRFSFAEHVIIWTLANGRLPKEVVDHIDGDNSNNRPDNLREATYRENTLNSRRKKLGLKGAYRSTKGRKPWFSQWWDGNRLQKLGSFGTEQEAHEAWVLANRDRAGEFFNDGLPDIFR